MFRGCCGNKFKQNMMCCPNPCGMQDMNRQYDMQGMMDPSCCSERQVVEPTITKCVEQEFYHEIPHVCPIHTHTINKHIYKHTYTPQFSCSEECQTVNMDCGKCSGFLG